MATAGKTITEFDELESAESADVLVIVDESEDETKFITKENFLQEYYDKDEIDTFNATFETLSHKGQPGGYVPLGMAGKIASEYIPAIALSEVYVVDDIEERDELDVQEGDFAIVTEEGSTYVYSGTEWIEMSASADVLSVNGHIGAVVLDTDDIAEGGVNLYYTDARVASYLSANDYLQAGDNVSALSNDAGYLTNGTHWTKTETVLSYMAGNVGIGTTSPLAPLHVQQNTNSAGIRTYGFGDNSDNWIGMYITTNGTARIASSENIYVEAPLSYLNNNYMALGNNRQYKFMYNSSENRFQLTDSADNLFLTLEDHGTTADFNFNQGHLFIDGTNGNVGIGTTEPSAKLDISSDILRLRTAKTPATAGATGNQGDICWDDNYIYVCVSTNTWKRAAIATW